MKRSCFIARSALPAALPFLSVCLCLNVRIVSTKPSKCFMSETEKRTEEKRTEEKRTEEKERRKWQEASRHSERERD